MSAYSAGRNSILFTGSNNNNIASREMEVFLASAMYSQCTTPGLHNKIPANEIFARGWVAQEPIHS